jgi:putative transposase
VDAKASGDLRASRRAVPERFNGRGMGAPGAADSAWQTGGPPAHDRHAGGVNAILYLLRTGCPWRYLPHDGFPPRSTVYNIFRSFQREGVWEAMWADLHMELREELGREASPSAAIIDSQSLKSAEKGAVTTGWWATTPARR